MAVKTITIDMEAYEALARQKRSGQSFSQVIKEHFGTLRTGRDLRTFLERARLSESTLDTLDEIIDDRRKSPASAADL